MRLTIVPDDKVAIVDGEGYFDVDVSSLDANIHAIQWYDTYGEIEFKDETNNEKIEDISFCDSVVSAWGIAKKKNNRPNYYSVWDKETNDWKDDLVLKAKIDLQREINSAKKFLFDTDFKMLPNYVPKPDEDLEALVIERNAKREFIRANEND